ncbi:MAG: proline dehydrogenase family protein, partial [Burkholderiaceae bacterium]
LVRAVRARRTRASGVDALMHEFSLSSEEGVALMCLAEALLRIPDRHTADRLIADKISRGDWRRHLGESSSLFVNAATWGLLITGKLVGTSSEQGLGSALNKLIAKGGEPLIRKGVDLAMRMLGNQFVTGQTIAEALANSRDNEKRGYRYSYDMLGEAALTADDAARYYADYENAIHAIGRAANGRGIQDGPGISVKLSALHPRYARAQRARVLAELLPRLKSLLLLAKQYGIGLNIDAEEADRLELSLDLMEALAFDSSLAGFDGIGFVVQAYQKRCPFVIDYLADLAERSGHRFMVRLVKGAYWDSEIKRAQEGGMPGYPVYTRKVHTDVSYLYCAQKLLGLGKYIYPQFATHNAQTLATIYTEARARGVTDYEFQCLHGMGEALYDQVVGKDQLDRPCRIYAPVGSRQTLLAYLVRRLLENGANSSFVNQIVDEEVPIDALVADPVEQAQKTGGRPHPQIPLPADLYGAERRNSAGLDFSDEDCLRQLGAEFAALGQRRWDAAPLLAVDAAGAAPQPVTNPAERRDEVGSVRDA